MERARIGRVPYQDVTNVLSGMIEDPMTSIVVSAIVSLAEKLHMSYAFLDGCEKVLVAV